jgi:hypothetical protein
MNKTKETLHLELEGSDPEGFRDVAAGELLIIDDKLDYVIGTHTTLGQFEKVDPAKIKAAAKDDK